MLYLELRIRNVQMKSVLYSRYNMYLHKLLTCTRGNGDALAQQYNAHAIETNVE